MNNKNFFIVLAVLMVSVALSMIFYLPARLGFAVEAKMPDFPKVVGEWASKDIPLTQREYDLLETKNLIMRDYKNIKGDSVNLYIIYSRDNRKVAHPPEICLQGGGATITSKVPMQMADSIKANMIILEEKGSRQLVVYWYRSGSLNTNSYISQQLHVVFSKMLRKKTSVAMVRILTKINEDDKGAALQRIKAFCIQIQPLLNKYVP